MRNLTEEKIPGIKAGFELKEPEDKEAAKKWIIEQEAIGNRPPTTRKGTIETIIEGDEENQRIIVVSCNGVYIYIFNDSLVGNMKKMSSEKLKNKSIRFKLVGKYQDKYVGSCSEIDDFYKTAMAHGKIMTGKLIEVSPSRNNRYEKEGTILSKGDILYIKAGDLALPNFLKPEECINKNLDFVVREVTPTGKVYVSTVIPSDFRKQQLNYFFNTEKSFKATVAEVKNFGAFLIYKNNVALVLRNKDFSANYTACKKVLEPGDILDVKIKEIDAKQEKYIVEMVEKVVAKQTKDLNEIKVKDVFDGEVVTVEPFGCFVNIATGVDVLCPIGRDKREPIMGDTVRVEISAVYPDNNKIRGNIIKFNDNLPDLSEFHLLKGE